MKICPQCKSVFPEDYVFCMTDGTTLDSDNQEQETVVREKIITPDKTSALSPDMLVVCLKCNLANRAASKFCKKCGNPFGSVEVPVNQPFPLQIPNNSTDSPTVYVSTPNSLPPPNISNASPVVSMGNGGNKQMMIIGGLIGCVLLMMVVIIAMKSGNDSTVANANTNVSEENKTTEKQDNDSDSSNANVEANKMEEAVNNASSNANVDANANMGSANSNIESSGSLAIAITNVVVRESPSPNSAKVAVFFSNSKMQILETQRSETGTIWYRVKVTEYGCNALDNTVCGKDDYYDSEEGWVFSKYVSVR